MRSGRRISPRIVRTARVLAIVAGGTTGSHCSRNTARAKMLPVTLGDISIMPISPTLKVGDSLRLTVFGIYSNDSIGAFAGPVTWASSDSGVLEVSGTSGKGLVRGAAAGHATVYASIDGHAANMQVQVARRASARPTLLSISPTNPRYFQDAQRKVVYLTGAHTWLDLQDVGSHSPPKAFDYGAFLHSLVRHHQNFFRLWSWEQSRWMVNLNTDDIWVSPLPYRRTGPGEALDGLPKFDLTKFNPRYFERMRARIEAAGKDGIYVSIMLFNGWSIVKRKGDSHSRNPWLGNPFNKANNVNGVNGDPNSDDSGEEVEELLVPAVTALQEAFVRKVINTVDDLDNVLYEVTNEGGTSSLAWQYVMIDYIKSYEATKPKQHPVGMTAIWPGGTNAELYASPAGWISPNGSTADPPPADGRKVVISDTDHLCGICGSRAWVWKAFARGENPIFMDIYNAQSNVLDPHDLDNPKWEEIRRALGVTRMLAQRIHLARMTPHGELTSTGYCLADMDNKDAELIVYAPDGGPFKVDLSPVIGTMRSEWVNPTTGSITPGASILGGKRRTFQAPFGGDAVLHLFR